MAYKRISKQRIRELIERFRQVEDLDPQQTFERLRDLRDDEGWRYGEGFSFPPKKVSNRKLKELVWEEITVGGRTRSFFGLRSLPGGDDGVECQYCGKDFPDASAALEHMEQAHPDQDAATVSGGGGTQDINVNVQGGGQGGGSGGGSSGSGFFGGQDRSDTIVQWMQYWVSKHAVTPGDWNALEQKARNELPGKMDGPPPSQDELDRAIERVKVWWKEQKQKAQEAREAQQGKMGDVERIMQILPPQQRSDSIRQKLLEDPAGALERKRELAEEMHEHPNFDTSGMARLIVQDVDRVTNEWEGIKKSIGGLDEALQGTNIRGGTEGMTMGAMQAVKVWIEKQERAAPWAAMALAPVIALGGMGVGLGPFGLIFGALFFGWGYKNLGSRNEMLGAFVSIGAIYAAVLDLIFIATNVMLGGFNSLMTLYGLASVVVLGTAVYLIEWDLVKWAYENFATLLFGPKEQRDTGYEILFFFTVVLGFIASVSGILQVGVAAVGGGVQGFLEITAFFLSILGPLALYHLSKNFHAVHGRLRRDAGMFRRGGGGPPALPAGPDRPALPSGPDRPALPSGQEGRQALPSGQEGRKALPSGEEPVAALPSGSVEARINTVRDGLEGGGSTAGLIKQLADTLMEIEKNPDSAKHRNVSRDQFMSALDTLEAAYRVWQNDHIRDAVDRETFREVQDIVDPVLDMLGRRR